jgi:hypothetical protein
MNKYPVPMVPGIFFPGRRMEQRFVVHVSHGVTVARFVGDAFLRWRTLRRKFRRAVSQPQA